MFIAKKGSVAAALLLLISLDSSYSQAAESEPINPPHKTGVPDLEYAITASGGISAGAYEAGYNWALIRYIKERQAIGTKPSEKTLDLAVVSGASAGGINTFLSALTYCQNQAADQEETPEKNLFFEAWVPVGLDGLLPSNQGGYEQDDAVLARSAFKPVEEMLKKKVSEAKRYRQPCVLSIGMTVTRATPTILKGKSLEAPVDRFSVSLQATTTNDGLKFYDTTIGNEVDYVKPYLHLVPDAKTPLSPESLVSLLRASSAFPLAFGLQRLDFFESATPTGSTNGSQKARKPKHGLFWDGGLYDNLPVGLALALVEQRASGAPVQIIALDPHRMRADDDGASISMKDDGVKDKPARGFKHMSQIADNLLSVATKYELQNFLRFALHDINHNQCTSGSNCIEEPLVSSRYFPIFGERLEAFGAFVLRAFREFDFAVGVYDALYSFAEQDCDGDTDQGYVPHGQCIIKHMSVEFENLAISKSARTSILVRKLLKSELRERFGDLVSTVLDVQLANGKTGNQWLADEQLVLPTYFDLLYADMADVKALKEPETLFQELDRMDRVISKLAASKFVNDLSEQDKQLVTNPTWVSDTVMRAIRRDQQVEKDDDYFAGKRISGFLSFGFGTNFLLTKPGLDLDPSTVADEYTDATTVAYHLLPYYFSASSRRAETGWRPTMGIFRNFAVGLPIAASIHFPQENYRWGAHAGIAAIIRFHAFYLSAVEIGPRATLGLRDDGSSVTFGGGQLATYWLAGKLRIGATVDGPLKSFSQVQLTVGFADFNGMLWHIFTQ